jgi:alpha-ketoglutarate-dependent taurine dioxygenase
MLSYASRDEAPNAFGEPTAPLPGQPRYGKELRNVDIRSLTDEDILQVRRLLAAHGLLVFRDQILEDRHLVEFSQRFGSGKIEPPPKAFNAPSEYIAYLTNLKKPDGSNLGFGADTTDVWHSDQEFKETPASLALLYCLIPTEGEGATSFATTAVRNLDLDEPELAQLRELWSTRQAANIVSHPVIEANPLTGEEFVYVSENSREFIGPDGETIADSEQKASHLLGKILRPENIYSHQWQSGDVVLYDNMQLVHRREEYKGIRFLKVIKLYPDGAYLGTPAGKTLQTPE